MVIATEVLEHQNFHPLPTLLKLSDAMRNKGVLFLSTPDASTWPPARKDLKDMQAADTREANYQWEDRGHVCQYTEEQLRDLLCQAGFIIDRLAYTVVCTPAAPEAPWRNINIQARKVGR